MLRRYGTGHESESVTSICENSIGFKPEIRVRKLLMAKLVNRWRKTM